MSTIINPDGTVQPRYYQIPRSNIQSQQAMEPIALVNGTSPVSGFDILDTSKTYLSITGSGNPKATTEQKALARRLFGGNKKNTLSIEGSPGIVVNSYVTSSGLLGIAPITLEFPDISINYGTADSSPYLIAIKAKLSFSSELDVEPPTISTFIAKKITGWTFSNRPISYLELQNLTWGELLAGLKENGFDIDESTESFIGVYCIGANVAMKLVYKDFYNDYGTILPMIPYNGIWPNNHNINLYEMYNLAIKDGSITTSKLATGSVTSDKINDGAILRKHLGSKIVEGQHIADLTIRSGNIQDSAVTTDKVANKAITEDKLADGVGGMGPIQPFYLVGNPSPAVGKPYGISGSLAATFLPIIPDSVTKFDPNPTGASPGPHVSPIGKLGSTPFKFIKINYRTFRYDSYTSKEYLLPPEMNSSRLIAAFGHLDIREGSTSPPVFGVSLPIPGNLFYNSTATFFNSNVWIGYGAEGSPHFGSKVLHLQLLSSFISSNTTFNHLALYLVFVG